MSDPKHTFSIEDDGSVNENWTATDCGKYIRVCAPNGGTCEMFGDSDDAHQRFAYFVLRQMIRDLAEVTEDRDAYRVSSEIRGANIEAMHEVLIELSALLAGQATDFRQVARDLRRMARASLDCSP